MAIQYTIENNVVRYKVSWCARSKKERGLKRSREREGAFDLTNPETGTQLKSEEIERKLRELEFEVRDDAKDAIRDLEVAGLSWGDLVDKWAKALGKDEGTVEPIKRCTSRRYIVLLSEHTKSWKNKSASQITPGNVKMLLRRLKEVGYKKTYTYDIKTAINGCFRYGIDWKLIPGLMVSPAKGISINRRGAKRPENLNTVQIAYFLEEARRRNHPWRDIWEIAFHSGMRRGELVAARCKDVDAVARMQYVERSYDFVEKREDTTKGGYWRQVAINDELMAVHERLRVLERDPEEHLIPWPPGRDWINGGHAKVTREFCKEIGLTGVHSICFHTIRACWATQLLANGVPVRKLMLMGGWEDYETMEFYIRTAGIEIHGATDSLQFRRKERPSRVLKLIKN